MSHEYLTIAYVHSLKDEMESDSGPGGKDDGFPDGKVRRRTLRLRLGTFLIRAGTWLVCGPSFRTSSRRRRSGQSCILRWLRGIPGSPRQIANDGAASGIWPHHVLARVERSLRLLKAPNNLSS